MKFYKVRDGDGDVIAQYYQTNIPEKPNGYVGDWEPEEADELNDEPVEWWDE